MMIVMMIIDGYNNHLCRVSDEDSPMGINILTARAWHHFHLHKFFSNILTWTSSNIFTLIFCSNISFFLSDIFTCMFFSNIFTWDFFFFLILIFPGIFFPLIFLSVNLLTKEKKLFTSGKTLHFLPFTLQGRKAHRCDSITPETFNHSLTHWLW